MQLIMQLYNKETLTVEFPDILRKFQGSDTQVEIITSSMLEKMRMSIRGYYVKEAVVYVVVQTYLQRESLPPILYDNALERAQEYVSLFRDLLKIDAKNVIVLKD